ncbi:MAG: NFACT family protein [Lachnospiraceae bacterium]|nr:NFACT family protein [Lachnospiraceae bacterium]
MAFDGSMVAAVTCELNKTLAGGRISKIQQPESDELVITVHKDGNYKLLLSANASLPLVYLTRETYVSPLVSPAFCMLLRKHVGSARITEIYQPEFERIIIFRLEHLDEMGDEAVKLLIIELMGKHSNIIFCDDKMTILDSIKRVPASVSSVREVLPGRPYFITKTVEKADPLKLNAASFREKILGCPKPLYEAIYTQITGIAPMTANEICFLAGVNPDLPACSFQEDTDVAGHIYAAFSGYFEKVTSGLEKPVILYKNGVPFDFAAVRPLSISGGEYTAESFDSPSEMLETYYASKDEITRIRQKSSDLSKVLSNAIARTVKKLELQQRQLKDTEKRDKFKVYGELLTAFGYNVPEGSRETILNNYYTGEDIKIPLDPDISPIENAKVYFARYSKLKRTFEAVSAQLEATREELEHLESVRLYLDMARSVDELSVLRDELAQAGYIKKNTAAKNGKGKAPGKNSPKSLKPYHYVTEDGFHLYVGRNNYQNDEITFKLAGNSDWWFHVKGNPGSHVILKTEGREVPDSVFETAAALAAYHSKVSGDEKTEVDYLERRNVKKPNGAKPGYVVYYTNYSMVASPGIKGLTRLDS